MAAPREGRHERSPRDDVGMGDAGEGQADGGDVCSGGVEVYERVLDEEVGVVAGLEDAGMDFVALEGGAWEKRSGFKGVGVGEVIM